MNAEQLAFFVARYRTTDSEALAELCDRLDSLAEEAQAALVQVAAERGISVLDQQRDQARRAREQESPRDREERLYSPARAQIIHRRKLWFLWSLPLACLAGAVYESTADAARGTLAGHIVGAFGLFAFIGPLYYLYKLSFAVEPKRSVAWSMVAIQFIPIAGWLAVISLVQKASRIRKAVTAHSAAGAAAGANAGANAGADAGQA